MCIEQELQDTIEQVKGIIAMLPALWAHNPERLPERRLIWEGWLTNLEERLYHLRNGDVVTDYKPRGI